MNTLPETASILMRLVSTMFVYVLVVICHVQIGLEITDLVTCAL